MQEAQKTRKKPLLVSAGREFSEEGSKHLRNNGTYTSVRTALYSRTIEPSQAPLLETYVRVVHDYSLKEEAVPSSKTLVSVQSVWPNVQEDDNLYQRRHENIKCRRKKKFFVRVVKDYSEDGTTTLP
jgi:hypothetical protein